MKVAIEPSRTALIQIKVSPSPNECEQEATFLEIKGSTLRNLLLELSERYKYQGNTKLRLIDSLTGEVDSEYEVFVNGKMYVSLTKGLDSNLEKGDLVEIITYILGGG